MRADIAARGLSEILQRFERAITTGAVFGARSGAAREDVLSTWRQLIALHQKTHALLREMKDAERALAEDDSEASLAWLKDIQARMAEADGTEALIEGFGELSGRFQKSV
jgi:DNA primase